MKTFLIMCCFLVPSAALAQLSGGAGVVSNEPVVVEMPSHSAHASQQEMGASQDIMESSNSVSAEGERPLWEVAPHTKYVPLGDTARMLRKEQFAAKKATKIWEN